MQDLTRVRSYYCDPRSVGGRRLSVYTLWEEGLAFNDSITPAGFSKEYQEHVTSKILSITTGGQTTLSLGCGNGFIEAALAKQGRRVRAIDCNEQAVSLARSKGVDAFLMDYFSLRAGELTDVDLVYADGLLGHLYDECSGLGRFFERLAELAPRPGCWLLVSNDAPRSGDGARRHETLTDFWHFPGDLVAAAAERVGFETREAYYFQYLRPISGPRKRTIYIAQMGAARR